MPRIAQGPPLFMILMGLVIGAGGIALIRLGVDERMSIVVGIGAGITGSGLASVLMGLTQGLRVLARKSKEITLREYRQRRELWRPVLLGAALTFALLFLVAGHNYAAWHEIERDCVFALETDNRIDALVAWQRATGAMKSRLLLIPSDLFDLWGANRCRSAAERHGFPPPALDGGARRAGSSPSAPGPGLGSGPSQPGRPQMRKYNLRDQEMGDEEFIAWLEQQEEYNGLTDLVLEGNRLTAASLAALAASEIGVFNAILLGDNPIGDRGAEILAASPAFTTVTILYLGGAGLSSVGLEPIFAADSRPRFLRSLDLTGNDLGDQSADIIAGSALTRQITHLYLDDTGLTDRAVRVLADSPNFEVLEYLSLDGNDLTETGVAQARQENGFPQTADVYYGERFE
jgi:hypothetical protein